MALLGGGVGGAGNPLGGSFTGPAQALEYSGKGDDGGFVYAYSGQVIVNNTTVTCLEFTTGSGYVVAQFSQAVDYTAIGGGKLVGFTIELNGTVICTNLEATDTAGKSENNGPLSYEFIIPPYTEVKTSGTTDGAADNPFFHTIVGRIYK